MIKRRDRERIRIGDVIKGRYIVREKLGHGSFGDVYACSDTDDVEEVALKVEGPKKNCKQVLQVEKNAMRNLQKSPYVVRLKETGKVQGLNYVIMERLGPDLSVLRKKQPSRTFSLFTVLHLGVQMINICESIHSIGWIHRDIKPSNYCVGRKPSSFKQVYLIDFSLARCFKNSNDTIKVPRKKVGFRGTSRFASVNSHRGLDLYPRDDLWSVWYTLLEMLLGKLPWEGMKDRQQVGLMKAHFHSNEVYKNVPDEFDSIRRYLFSLSYIAIPDYDYIRTVLVSLFHKRSYSRHIPLDWEIPNSEQSSVSGSFDENNGILNAHKNSASNSVVSIGSSCFSMGGESVNSYRSSFSSSRSSFSNTSFEVIPRSPSSSIRSMKFKHHRRRRATSFAPPNVRLPSSPISLPLNSMRRRRRKSAVTSSQTRKRSDSVEPKKILKPKDDVEEICSYNISIKKMPITSDVDDIESRAYFDPFAEIKKKRMMENPIKDEKRRSRSLTDKDIRPPKGLKYSLSPKKKKIYPSSVEIPLKEEKVEVKDEDSSSSNGKERKSPTRRKRRRSSKSGGLKCTIL